MRLLNPLTTSRADSRYLLLDCSNDPLLGPLDLVNASSDIFASIDPDFPFMGGWLPFEGYVSYHAGDPVGLKGCLDGSAFGLGNISIDIVLGLPEGNIAWSLMGEDGNDIVWYTSWENTFGLGSPALSADPPSFVIQNDTGERLRVDGMSGDIETIGSCQASNFISTTPPGTSPISCSSTDLCANLNADMLDGLHSSSFSQVGHTHSIDRLTTTFSGWTSTLTDNGTYFILTYSGPDAMVKSVQEYMGLGGKYQPLGGANYWYDIVLEVSRDITEGYSDAVKGFAGLVATPDWTPPADTRCQYFGMCFLGALNTSSGSPNASSQFMGAYYRLNIGGNNSNLSTSTIGGMFEANRSSGSGYTDTLLIAGKFMVRNQAAGTLTAQTTLYLTANVSSNATSTTVREIFASWDSACAGMCTNWNRIDIRNVGGDGTVNTLRGIYISNLTKGNVNYGIQIDAFSNAGGNDFEIYNAGRLYQGKDIVLSTSGVQIGTATNQKLAFWGATPVTQPATVNPPSGGSVVDVEARQAISTIIDRLKTLGLIGS